MMDMSEIHLGMDLIAPTYPGSCETLHPLHDTHIYGLQSIRPVP